MLPVPQIKAEMALGRFLERSGPCVSLAEGALILSLEAYPDMAMHLYMEMLEEMTMDLVRMGLDPSEPFESLKAINHYLFVRRGFTPTPQEDYYNEKNSYFNEVLTRKTGIPVTLSVLYIEMAQRMGLDVYGVGLRGHFMVGIEVDHEPYFLDTFRQGLILNRHTCKNFFDDMHDGRVKLREEDLSRVNSRTILVRILQNLKYIHLKNQQVARALSALDRVLMLDPGAWHARRERAMLAIRHEYHSRALLDLLSIKESHPEESEEFAAVLAGLERKFLWKN